MTRVAWEWRLFTDTPSLLPVVDLPGPAEEREEYDLYLVAPDVHDNVKVRNGGLELKRFVRHGPDGLQLWQDKESFSFPLPPSGAAMLADLFRVALPGSATDRLEAFIPFLRKARQDLVSATVWKRRYRWALSDGCRVETAVLTFPRVGSCWSFSVDSYELDPLLRQVPTGLDAERCCVCGYVELLQRMAGFRGEGERPPWATSFHSSLRS